MSVGGVKGGVQADFSAEASAIAESPAAQKALSSFSAGVSIDIGAGGVHVHAGAQAGGGVCNPGNLGAPSQSSAPSGGYAAGSADGPNDTGAMGADASAEAGQTDGTQNPAGGDSSLADILKMPFPGNVMRLLAKLAHDAEGTVTGQAKAMAEKQGSGAKLNPLNQEDQTNMQIAQQNLSDIRNLLSGLMKDMHDINSTIIRNTQ